MKSLRGVFSRGKLETGKGGLGLCKGRRGITSMFVKALLSVLGEFRGILYADHVRFHLRHPYIERVPTLRYLLTFNTFKVYQATKCLD